MAEYITFGSLVIKKDLVDYVYTDQEKICMYVGVKGKEKELKVYIQDMDEIITIKKILNDEESEEETEEESEEETEEDSDD